MSEQVVAGKIVERQSEQQGGLLVKLLIFSVSLGIVPLSSYYLSRDYLWDGNTTFAAITAVVGANIVLVAYIIESLRDEARLQAKGKGKQPAETKKNR